MQDFRKLKVWNKAHQLTLLVYSVTKGFPREELYGLTSQVRRCAASIPSNIAEGCGRGVREFQNYLRIAMGSANELDYQILLAKDLSYLKEEDYLIASSRITEVRKMLSSLMKAIMRSQQEKKTTAN